MTFCANPTRRCEVFLSLANNIYLKSDESVSWSEFLFLNKLEIKICGFQFKDIVSKKLYI